MSRKLAVLLLLCSAAAAMAQTPGKRVNVDCMDKPALDRYEKAFQRIRDRNPNNDPNVDELHKSYRFYTRIHNGTPPRGSSCNHMNELFLPWHRAALRIFELALQEADKENGGDGTVMLPYWNWTQPPSGKFYPLPFERDAALQPTGDPRRNDVRQNPLYQPGEVQHAIDNARSWRQLGGRPCSDPDCARPAPNDPCPSCGAGGAIEDPYHNLMHGWIGGDMKTDTRAATDPLFWSFHAYIDLLFDQWQRDNRYPTLGCLDCAFRGMTGWTTRRVEHTDAIGYEYDSTSCTPPRAKIAAAAPLALHAMSIDVAHNTRSAAEGPLVFDVAVPTGYFRTAEIELARAELPSDFSYSGHVYLYPAETKLDLTSSAFRKRWRVGGFAVWALHHDAEHNHGSEANLFVDATTELEYIQKHQPGSKWKVAVVVDEVDPVDTKTDAKALRSRIVIDDVRVAIDRGRGEAQ